MSCQRLGWVCAWLALSAAAHAQDAGPLPPPAALLPPTAPDALPPPPPLLDVPAVVPSDGSPPASPVVPPIAPLSPAAGVGAGGAGGMGLLFSPVVGQVPVAVSYRAADFFSAPVKNQDTTLGYLEQDFSLLTPIWQCATDELSGHVRVADQAYFTHAVLPDTQQRFPSELWNVQMGGNYRHLYDNGWIAGGGVSVGSASDKPFHGLDEMSVSANASLRVPSGEHNAWIFSLNMSSNSQVLPFVPIPGIAYFYAPGPSFQALIGFPFASATWRPTDDLTFQATYALLTTFHGRVYYRLARPLSLYAGIDFENQNWYRVGRADVNDRFFYYDDRLTGGLQLFLSRRAVFDLSAGYAFDRFYFEGTNSTSQNFNRIDVGDGAFVAASFRLRF
ncbi:MAG TPA: hypothetical protein VFE78_03535 [Gemmataceae bacterium]|nr:hypothetical protein [Gemmataceae bacterium]